MVSRSVPQYAEILRMLAELAAFFATPDSIIYDLGCSTGTTLALVGATRQCQSHRRRQLGRDARQVPLEARDPRAQ
jgi:hypothetical protein